MERGSASVRGSRTKVAITIAVQGRYFFGTAATASAIAPSTSAELITADPTSLYDGIATLVDRGSRPGSVAARDKSKRFAPAKAAPSPEPAKSAQPPRGPTRPDRRMSRLVRNSASRERIQDSAAAQSRNRNK